jgi:hypothetical protein
MGTDEDVVSIYTEVMATGSYTPAELDELLKEPSAAVLDTPVRERDLQLETGRREAKDGLLVNELQLSFPTELDNLRL